MIEKENVVAAMGGGAKSSPEMNENNYIEYTVVGSAFVQRRGRKIKLISFETYSGKEEKIVLEDGDKLVTEKGCAFGIYGNGSTDKEAISLTLFPNSEVILSIKSSKPQSISKIELVQGVFMFSIVTQGRIEDKLVIPLKYPEFEFKPLFGEYSKSKQASAIMELNRDSSIVIFSTINRIMNKSTKLIAGGINAPGNLKITLKNNSIYCSNNIKNPDERVSEIRNRLTLLSQYSSYFAGKKALIELQKSKDKKKTDTKKEMLLGLEEQLKNAQKLGDESLINLAKEQIESTKAFFEKTPIDEEDCEEIFKKRKKMLEQMVKQAESEVYKLFSPLPYYSALNEEDKIISKTIVKRTGKNYETLISDLQNKEGELEEKYSVKSKPTLGAAIAFETQKLSAREDFMNQLKSTATQKGITAITGSANISEKYTYQKIDFEIMTAQKGTELGLRVAQNGKEFLTVDLRATNKSTSDAFLSPDESFKIIVEGTEFVPVNYTIPTNIDPGKNVEGYVLFMVPQDAKDFEFQIGKKVEEKKKFKFKI